MRLTPQNRGLTNKGTPTRAERREAALKRAAENGGKLSRKDAIRAREMASRTSVFKAWKLR